MQDVYPVGNVFHRLVHLKICTCATEWLNLLVSVLSESPKLRALKLDQVRRSKPELFNFFDQHIFQYNTSMMILYFYPSAIPTDLMNRARAGMSRAQFLIVSYLVLKLSNG